MDSIKENIERRFFDEICKKNGVVVQIGVRYSGKTLWFCSALSYFIKNDCFESYHLVLPSYRFQRDNTYKFLELLPKDKGDRITIYEDFGVEIVELLLKNRKKNGNTLFLIDDATNFNELFYTNENVKKLITLARHLSISTWLVSHTLLKTLSPQIRANISYIVLHRVSNMNLLSSFHEEILSMFIDKKDFLDFLKRELRANDFYALVIDKDRSQISHINSMEWDRIKKERLYIQNINNNNITKKNNESNRKENVKANTTQNTIKTKQQPPCKFPKIKSFKVVIR